MVQFTDHVIQSYSSSNRSKKSQDAAFDLNGHQQYDKEIGTFL